MVWPISNDSPWKSFTVTVPCQHHLFRPTLRGPIARRPRLHQAHPRSHLLHRNLSRPCACIFFEVYMVDMSRHLTVGFFLGAGAVKKIK